MSKIVWFGVVSVTQGHWKLHQSTEHIRVPISVHSNYVPVLHCFWDTTRYWSKIAYCNLPHLCLAPPFGHPWNFAKIFGIRNLESLG